MKNCTYIFIALLTYCMHSYGQKGVSGYVTIQNPDQWEQRVYLSQLTPEKNKNTYQTTSIASTKLTEAGFFSFQPNVFTGNDNVYKIELKPISTTEKQKLSDTITYFKRFIASKNDSIYFEKGTAIFGNYTSSNKADREWNKLKKHEATYKNLTTDFDPKKYLLETKGYVKDSLQILLVKLIGIKRLDEQNLLEKDILANPAFYLDLLKELKSSELEPATYAYLEQKLFPIVNEISNSKKQTTIWIYSLIFLSVSMVLLYFFRFKKRLQKPIAAPLSKQEKAIKDLIISGKSNKEIASELFISLSTVKTHITNIYNKLNISNRKELLLKK